MAAVRRGREAYAHLHGQAMRLHTQGKSTQDIAAALGISYSCAYHWVRGLRMPGKGRVNEFIAHLEQHGPQPAIEVKARFPKHNEVFLIAQRRRLAVQRCVLEKRFGEYRTWYFLPGQEDALQARVQELRAKVRELLAKLVVS